MAHARTLAGRTGANRSTGVPGDGAASALAPPHVAAPAAARDGESPRLPFLVLFVGKRATARQLGVSPIGRYSASSAPGQPITEAGIELEHGIHLLVVTSQRAALQLVKADLPQVIMVEVDSRPQSRERFCRMLRTRYPTTLLFGVGDRQPEGAFTFDDFLFLPLNREQVASVVTRVRGQQSYREVACGPFRLDLATRMVDTPNGPRHMTPKLCALLELLMLRRNEVVSRSDIMQSIWETSYLDDTRTLDVHVRWLREYIEPDPSRPTYLITVRGTGYILRCR